MCITLSLCGLSNVGLSTPIQNGFLAYPTISLSQLGDIAKLNPIFTKLNEDGKIGETGVDEIAHANIKFKNGIEAKVSTAIRESMKNNAIIKGTNGTIELPDPWMPGRDGGPYHAKIIIKQNNETEIIDIKGPEHLFFFEAELASQSIAKEKVQAPHPAMNWEDTLGNLKALDEWRNKINYKLTQDE